jgi:hypothetical protein
MKNCTARVFSQVLTTQKHAVGFSEASDLVSAAEGECALFRLSGILIFNEISRYLLRAWQLAHPFHAVRGSDLTKHLVVVQNRRVRSIRKLRIISSGTKVELPRSFGKRLKLRSRRGTRAASR